PGSNMEAWGRSWEPDPLVRARRERAGLVGAARLPPKRGPSPPRRSPRWGGDGPVTVSPTVSVADAGLMVVGGVPRLGARAGTAVVATLATFGDDDPGGALGDYTATVDWGDGGTPQALTVGAVGDGTFTVRGGHTYAKAGRYTALVRVRDQGGAATNAVV